MTKIKTWQKVKQARKQKIALMQVQFWGLPTTKNDICPSQILHEYAHFLQGEVSF